MFTCNHLNWEVTEFSEFSRAAGIDAAMTTLFKTGDNWFLITRIVHILSWRKKNTEYYKCSYNVFVCVWAEYTREQVDIVTQGWFIGLMCAIALLVLIMLTVFFIKKTRGGKYPGIMNTPSCRMFIVTNEPFMEVNPFGKIHNYTNSSV